MVPDPKMTCLGLEYFCFEGDGLVDDGRHGSDGARHEGDGDDRPDRSHEGRRRDGRAHAEGLSGVRRRLSRTHSASFAATWTASRTCRWPAGTACTSTTTRTTRWSRRCLSVQNLLGGHHDVWAVNADDEYHEEVDLGSGDAGQRAPRAAANTAFSAAGAAVDRLPVSGSRLLGLRTTNPHNSRIPNS